MICNRSCKGKQLSSPDVYCADPNQIIDVLSSYLKNWLEDAIPAELYQKMAETIKPYNMEDQKRKVLETFGTYQEEKTKQLEVQLNKLQPVEETK